MARNKYPEETVNLILNTAYHLFMEKGYEHTSIQEIINHLGGLSKGAIYHHFKSKEDILEAVTDRMTEESNRLLAKIRDRSDLNGRPVQDEIFEAAPSFQNNPRLLCSLLNETVKIAAPDYIQPVIEQGIADGSIQTDYPKQFAELIVLVANVWMNPMTFQDTEEESIGKVMVFRQMMQGFGLDIIDDEMEDRFKKLTAIYQKKK